MITDEEVNERLRARKVADHVQGVGRRGLISKWQSFVEQVELGYQLEIYEYWNDLDMREIIEYCGLGTDPDVIALDQRFCAQLVRTDLRIWRSAYAHAFWINGYPKTVSEDFISDAVESRK